MNLNRKTFIKNLLSVVGLTAMTPFVFAGGAGKSIIDIADLSPEKIKEFAEGVNNAFIQLGYFVKKDVKPEDLLKAVEESFGKNSASFGFVTDEDLTKGVGLFNKIVSYVKLEGNNNIPEAEKPELTKRLLKNFMVDMERLRDNGNYEHDRDASDYVFTKDNKFYSVGTTEYIDTYRKKNDKDPYSNLFIPMSGANTIILDKYTNKNFVMPFKTEGYSSHQADRDATPPDRIIIMTGKLAMMLERRTDNEFFNKLYEEIKLDKYKNK